LARSNGADVNFAQSMPKENGSESSASKPTQFCGPRAVQGASTLSKEATLARLLWMDDLVAAVGRGEMPTSAIGAGYVISRKVNSKSGVAWAKQKIMAKMIGIKEDSFQRLVRVLHDHGFLGITVKWADGKKHNHYVLTRPAADERYLNPGIPATDPDLNPGRYTDLNPVYLSKVVVSNQ
jgi:hypothetical protein